MIELKLNRDWWFDVSVNGCPRRIVFRRMIPRTSFIPEMIDVTEQVSARAAKSLGRLIKMGDDMWEWRPAWRARDDMGDVVKSICLHWNEVMTAKVEEEATTDKEWKLTRIRPQIRK